MIKILKTSEPRTRTPRSRINSLRGRKYGSGQERLEDKKQWGLTLIELLVVLAIIGLLATVILVNVRGSREKARTAKALSFSHSIQNSLGAWLQVSLHFDEGMDSTAYDSSGYENDGTILGADWTTGIIDDALYFDGSSDEVRVFHSDSLNVTDRVTVEAWIKPADFSPGFKMIVNKLDEWEGYNLYMIGNEVGFHVQITYLSGGGGSVWVNAPLPAPAVDKWYHVVGTYDGNLSSDNLAIYANGELLSKYTKRGFFEPITVDLFIGRPSEQFEVGTWGYFYGDIDEVRVYNASVFGLGE